MNDIPTVTFASSPAEMDDTALAMFALDDSAMAKRCQAEVERRAMLGNIGMQRFIAFVGLRAWAKGLIDVAALECESLRHARMVVQATGREADRAMLSSITAILASDARAKGHTIAADNYECETLQLLGELANNSDDPDTMLSAAESFNELAATYAPHSREQAEALLWCDAWLGGVSDEPEVSAFRRAKGEN